ncbi:MAG TPA: HipA domain-containing protein [Gemmatimonadales bacterium]|nr:HipA domain-containing protein [Gemmatimonadales bacterium]
MTAQKKALKYDTSQPLLDVYMYGHHVGYLGEDLGDVWFRYDKHTLDVTDSERWQVSVRLPVREEPYGPEETRAFFDNLLAESDVRGIIARATQHDLADLPGLLGQVGGECAGAVSLWPHETPPPPPAYRSLTIAEVEQLFSQVHGEPLTRAQLESRQSMSGAQDKLVFRRTPTGYDLPLAGSLSDVLIKRPSARYDGLVQNEIACLLLTKAVGLSIAQPRAVRGQLALFESTRFDRVPPDLRRLHQEDFCQATGRLAVHKYQHNRGPTLGDIANVLTKFAARPAVDIENLLRMTFVNVCIGNFDAHAKNFALLYDDDGIKLAPFYDVVSSEVYDFLTPQYALFVGSARGPGDLTYEALDKLARMVNWKTSLILQAAEQVADQVAAQFSGVLTATAVEAGHAEVLDRLAKVIETRVRTLRRATLPRINPSPRRAAELN